MALYVLDTDSVSLFARGNAALSARLSPLPAAEVAVTVITVEEVLSGWYDVLRRPLPADQLARAYERLAEAVEILSRFPILRYTEAAILRYEHLKSLRLNVGKMDLKIASVALEHGAVLVTRNRRDFARIPGLRVDDWSEV